MPNSLTEVTPKTEQANIAATEAAKAAAPKTEQANPESWKAPSSFAKEMHNYSQSFDPARYARGNYQDDTVQITTNDALNMYGRTAVIAPVAGVATLLTGTAVAADGLLRVIASPVLPEEYMNEGFVRMAEGAKMVAKGAALVVAGPLSLLTTPLAVLIQKATGFDAFKSFSKAMGYREVNAENPLNSQDEDEISIRLKITKASDEKTTIQITNNNLDRAAGSIATATNTNDKDKQSAATAILAAAPALTFAEDKAKEAAQAKGRSPN